jgi:hypothetical protein
MIKIPTVLVLGAGASMPFGFPSGQSLVDLIIRYFYLAERGYGIPPHSEKWFKLTIEKMKLSLMKMFSKKEVDSFLEHLYDEESIDAFLEYQTEDAVKIGKALIAATLFPFEREDNLDLSFIMKRSNSFFAKPIEKEDTEYNWYQLLWRALASDAKFEEFQENQLRIITFNYDRSLEHYLFNRLKRRFHGKTNQEYAAKIPKIIHIHGSLGLLPWQKQKGDKKFSVVPYDAMDICDKNKRSANRAMERWFRVARESITVIHEKGETDELKEARSWIKDYCGRLYFMGFGYHPSNIKRLEIEQLSNSKKYIVGTVRGLSYGQKRHVQEIFSKCSIVGYDRAMFEATNYEFLHNHVELTMG